MKGVLIIALVGFLFYTDCEGQSVCRMGTTAEFEMFLQMDIGTAARVKVTNLETGTLVYSDLVSSTHQTVLPGCNWLLNVGTPLSGASVDVNHNTLYKIEVGGEVLSYFDCIDHESPSEGFYCPNGDGVEFDVFLEFGGGEPNELRVFIDALGRSDPEDNVVEAFSDKFWMSPRDMDIFCSTKTEPERTICLAGISDLGTFLSGQVGPSFTYTDRDLTVDSGDLFTIGGEVDLSFQPGRKLKVDGALVVSGSNADNVVLDASGSSWSGICVSPNASATLSYTTVDGVQSYGGGSVYVNNGDLSINNSTIQNCAGACSGIYAYHSNPWLYRTLLLNNSQNGVSLNWSNGNIIQNNILDNGSAAVRVNYWSFPLLAFAGGTYFEGNNTMKGSTYGVYASSNSSPSVGVSASLAYNNRFKQNTYDAYATSDSDIVARYAYWGENPPNTGQIHGDVDYSNYLTIDPGAAFKTSLNNSPVVVVSELRERLYEGLILLHQNRFSDARIVFEEILATDANSREALRSLAALGTIYVESQDPIALSAITNYSKA